MDLRPAARFGAALLALVAPAAGAVEIFVGQGPDCSSGSLATAITTAMANGPGPHTIWLTSEISYDNQSLFVSGVDLTIRGVHGCDVLEDEMVTVNGNGTDSVFRITGTSNRDVTLKNLVVRGGKGTNGAGGGLNITGQVNVRLDNTIVRQNTAERGGGVYIENTVGASSGILYLLPGTSIENNAATLSSGGGVYAVGGRVCMHVSGTQIAANTAAGAGGGVALVSGELQTGKFVDQPDGTADGAKILSNTSGTAGGGIYAFGNNAFVQANELIVELNHARDAGGGVFASNGAYFGMQRDYPNVPSTLNCPAWRECSRLANNDVSQGAQGSVGGAIGLASGARAYIAQTIIRGNVAAEAPGIHVRGASAFLEGVLFTQNHSYDAPTQGTAMIRTVYVLPEAVPQLRVAYATFDGNVTTQSNGQVRAASSIIAQQNTVLSLHSVALFDSPFTPVTYSSYTDDCVVRGPGGTGADPNGTHTRAAVFQSAGFNNADAYDFRLRNNSALTDFCDRTAYTPEYRDIVLTPRCTDTPAKPDTHGQCDVGAYESDHIFGSGFQ